MRTFTPTSLARELEKLLGNRLPLVQVEAEVAQIHEPSSGHCYLQLFGLPSSFSHPIDHFCLGYASLLPQGIFHH